MNFLKVLEVAVDALKHVMDGKNIMHSKDMFIEIMMH